MNTSSTKAPARRKLQNVKQYGRSYEVGRLHSGGYLARNLTSGREVSFHDRKSAEGQVARWQRATRLANATAETSQQAECERIEAIWLANRWATNADANEAQIGNPDQRSK
jgi:hypothetical protein